jgi:hypothetical protein
MLSIAVCGDEKCMAWAKDVWEVDKKNMAV